MNDESYCQKTELSPMNPPEAYEPPNKANVSIEDMHPFLQELVKDHEAIKAALDKYEETVLAIKEKGIKRDSSEALREFFQFFSEVFITHNKREEKNL
ncbi:MAG: hypothetical protein Q8Q33_07640, partial [Chlamydiota bacterium]|nr:hypothetical protein [Chlamydiota bacterium]